jgi:hypothetical protein
VLSIICILIIDKSSISRNKDKNPSLASHITLKLSNKHHTNKPRICLSDRKFSIDGNDPYMYSLIFMRIYAEFLDECWWYT